MGDSKSASKGKGELTPRNRVFVREYLKDKNGARAYRAAYGVAKGAEASASRMLTNAKIRMAVDKGLAKLEAKLELTAERVLNRISEIAFHRPTAKNTDILKATEMLAKHFKLLTDVHELGGKEGGPIVVLTLPSNGSEKPEEEKKSDESSPV